MIRKILLTALALSLCVPAVSFAAKDYAAELKQEQKKLIKITKQLATQKAKLQKLTSEYEIADKAMRQRLANDKLSTDKKEFIRISKTEQDKLRKEYYKNKKPLAAENNNLKSQYHKCKKNIKRLTKQMDRKEKDPDHEAYQAKVGGLKGQISKLQKTRDNAIMKVREDADSEIAAITDMTQKSTIKNQILTKANEKELELRKKYTADKAVIGAKIDTARSEYKNSLKIWRMKKDAERKEQQVKVATEQRKKIDAQPVSSDGSSPSRASTNFSPAN